MELIQNILDGNHQAQETLYEKYKKSVENFLRNKFSIYNDLEDDVSEIMIKVFMNLEKYDETKSKFRSWVFNIAKNHIIDKWRSSTITTNGCTSYSCTISTDSVEFSNSAYITSSDITGVLNVGSSFITSNCADLELENCSSINYITSQLSPTDYTLLDMKYVQGYDYNEIGMEFNLTSTTISNRVNYIKTKLKKNNPEIIYE